VGRPRRRDRAQRIDVLALLAAGDADEDDAT
jgi:hypothetical protein